MTRLGCWAIVALLTLLAGCAPQAGGRPPAAERREAGTAEVRAVAVLHAWDRRRRDAWVSGDLRALRRLYVESSAAGRRDVAMLGEYVARGLRVSDLEMQVLRAAVLVDRPDRLVLRVTERLAATEVRTASGTGERALELPRDRAQTRLVELLRQEGRWRMASVRPARR